MDAAVKTITIQAVDTALLAACVEELRIANANTARRNGLRDWGEYNLAADFAARAFGDAGTEFLAARDALYYDPACGYDDVELAFADGCAPNLQELAAAGVMRATALGGPVPAIMGDAIEWSRGE